MSSGLSGRDRMMVAFCELYGVCVTTVTLCLNAGPARDTVTRQLANVHAEFMRAYRTTPARRRGETKGDGR